MYSACSYPWKTVRSNLESFLDSVTPIVPSHVLPQSCSQGLNSLWQPLDQDKIEYFNLVDLWKCYDEWSAYGVGTPVVLDNGESVMQYYAPYLSAIQIYTNKSMVAMRNDVIGIDCENSWSDDYECEKLSRSLSNNSSNSEATSEESLNHCGSWSMQDKLGYPYLHYCEYASPYWRIPLIEKITELACTYPGLNTLKSVDLSPASWMAVAWYPIYHIPNQRHVKDLSTCFLTYYTLSSSFQDVVADDRVEGKCNRYSEAMGCKSEGAPTKRENNTISLPPFGLASHKMVGDLWMKPDTFDYQKMVFLQTAADSWLKQLNVLHHDFNFFLSRSTV